MRIPPVHLLLALLVSFALNPTPEPFAKNDSGAQMDFGVQAARKGLWREALFRWEKARKAAPEDPKILNNLAVAYETIGEFGKADELYRAALRLDPNDRDIRQNYDLFSSYYRERRSRSAPTSGETPSDSPREERSDEKTPR